MPGHGTKGHSVPMRLTRDAPVRPVRLIGEDGKNEWTALFSNDGYRYASR